MIYTKISYSIIFLALLGFFSQALNASSDTLKIQPRMQYNVYKAGEFIGKAAMFYNSSTGIFRSGRELSSIRLFFFQETPQDFYYMIESYVFRDNLDLYLDSTINQQGVIYQAKRRNETPTGEAFQSKKTLYFYDGNKSNPAEKKIFASMLSSILHAIKKISSPGTNKPTRISYINKNEIYQFTMALQNEKLAYVKEKQFPVKIISVGSKTIDELSIEVFQNSRNYFFPVMITLNADEKNPLKFILDPEVFALENMKKAPQTVSFLGFIEADTGIPEGKYIAHQLILNVMKKEIHRQLDKIAVQENKYLEETKYSKFDSEFGNKIKQVMNITFDATRNFKDKFDRICNEIQKYSQSDIIVTGQFVDNPPHPWIMIRPVIFFKSKQKILTKNLLFKRTELNTLESTLRNKNFQLQTTQRYIEEKISNLFLSGIDEKFGEKGMTFLDALVMLSQNNFFVMPKDFGYQFEVLEKQRQNRTLIFSNGRDQQRNKVKNKEYLIETTSIDKNNPSDVINLFWAPLEGGLLNYQGARNLIEHLNKINYQGNSDWRLPSLGELFSISGYYNSGQNFFPFFHTQNERKIWTATPLAEIDRKKLSFSENDVFFVARCIHNGKNHCLHFDILDTMQHGYAIPVRSTFSRRDLIQADNVRKLRIAQIAFMDTDSRSPVISNELGMLLRLAVKQGIEMASSINQKMIAYKEKEKFDTLDNANSLSDIFFEPNTPNTVKIGRIIQKMMIPNQIDLLVTGYVINDKNSQNLSLRPIVIYKYDQKLKVENLSLETQKISLQKSTINSKSNSHTINLIANAIRDLLLQA